MLTSLHIENLAVIKSVDFDLTAGFMALTGETGAGKSVIIDSINLLLGAKADRELIRTGESSAMVSGLFQGISSSSAKILADAGIVPDEENSVLIQRTISLDGRSSVKINGRSMSLAILKAVAPALVNIHGQSDTAALTDSTHQLELIDLYAHTSDLLVEYKTVFSELESIRQQIRSISEKERERERTIEILEYQIADIDSYALMPNEEEELVEKKMKIKNSEKISKNSGFAYKALKGSEKGSVAFLLDKSATALMQISDVIPKFKEYSETLRDLHYQIEDIAEEVRAATDDIDDDPEQTLNEIESRLDKITKLKRKYGYTVNDILAFRDKCEKELDLLKNSDNVLKDLAAKEADVYGKALSIAAILHSKRTEAASVIETEVKATLEFLDMPKVVFFASITEDYESERKVLTSTGSDKIEFFISANRGADPQPLSKVASGGELARVMLALKSVIAAKDGVQTVIFDEIDTGVSGKTARKIGVKMLELSKTTQIIAVTHSAQIASLADCHFLISKSDVNGVTQTAVKSLDRDGRVSELSRILGGIDVTDAQRRAAIDMLDERKVYN